MFDITQIPNCVLDLRAGVGMFKDTSGTIAAVADGDVVKCWKDQSGNGNDMTTSGGGTTPELKLNQFGAGAALYVAPTSNNKLVSALSFSSSAQAYTVKVVGKAGTFLNQYLPLLGFTGGGSGYVNHAYLGLNGSNGNVNSNYTVYPGFPAVFNKVNPGQVPVILTLTSDGTNTYPTVNGDTPPSSSASTTVWQMLSPYLGQHPLGGSDESVYVARILIWSRALTAQESAEVDSALYATYPLAPQLLLVGDSLTLGVNSSTGYDYPTQMLGLLNATGIAPRWYNYGISGETLATIVSSAAATEDSACGQHAASTLITWGGTNDNTLSASSALTIYNLAVQYGLARKLFCPQRKLALMSMLPRGNSSTVEARRIASNSYLGSDFQVPTPYANVFAANPGVFYADYLVRLDLDAAIGLPGCQQNATYYEQAGQTHLTNAGYAIVAAYAASAYRAIVAAKAYDFSGIGGAPRF